MVLSYQQLSSTPTASGLRVLSSPCRSSSPSLGTLQKGKGLIKVNEWAGPDLVLPLQNKLLATVLLLPNERFPCWRACWCERCWSHLAQIYTKHQYVSKALEALLPASVNEAEGSERHLHPVWPDPVGTWSPSLQIWKVGRPWCHVLAIGNPTDKPITRICVHLYHKQ